MWLTAVVIAALSVQDQQTDTTFQVRAGTRLEIENFGGETVVHTWDKSAIRVQAEYGGRERIDIRNLGSVVTVKSESRYGAPRTVDYTITVPSRTDLSVSGVYQDVSVDGTPGGVTVSTVNGDVSVDGAGGFLSLKSVEGDVSVTGAKGKMVLSSVNASVSVHNSEGDVQAESVNGDVDLVGVNAGNVDISTVNGDLTYDGPIQDTGHYNFDTNNGDITVTVPETANTTVSVETFSGEFESAFPVKLTQSRKNRFTFVLGTGTGRVSLQSFQGTIRLAKPGEVRGKRGTGKGAGAGRGDFENENGNRTTTTTKVKTKTKTGHNLRIPDVDFDGDMPDHGYRNRHNRDN